MFGLEEIKRMNRQAYVEGRSRKKACELLESAEAAIDQLERSDYVSGRLVLYWPVFKNLKEIIKEIREE